MNVWLPGEWIVRDFRIIMYTPLYLKWITSKDLLYSTWCSAQCCVQPGWEGRLRENRRVYVYGRGPCCPPETITLIIGSTLIENKTFLFFFNLRKERKRGKSTLYQTAASYRQPKRQEKICPLNLEKKTLKTQQCFKLVRTDTWS